MTPKDRFTIIISVLALLVSSITAYINFFLRKYDVRANIDSDYMADRKQQRLELFVMNSGNRPVAVRRIRLVPYIGTGDASAIIKCASYGQRGPEIDPADKFEPFIVKAGEISFTRLFFDIAPHLQPSPNQKVLICTRFGFGAADRWRWAENPLLQISLNNGQVNMVDFDTKDISLISRWFASL